jgi:HPt (histidine-containing phosphotransfer) domain-containing protein
MFTAQTPGILKLINDSFEKGTLETVWQQAHKLKGTSLNIGARRLGELCRQIEMQGRNGQIEGLDELIRQLGLAYKETIRELRNLFQYN